MKQCGIYNIISKIDGKSYIGSTNDFDRRTRKHKCLLRRNKHDNPHLQNAWSKYGEQNFEWKFVEWCEIDVLLQIEQKHLNEAKLNPSNHYNLNFVAEKPPSPLGRKWSISSKEKFSALRMGEGNPRYGKKTSDETKKKMAWSRSKEYVFISPNGEIVNVKNLADFCDLHNLNRSGMYNVQNEWIVQYKGWKKLNFEKPGDIYIQSLNEH